MILVAREKSACSVTLFGTEMGLQRVAEPVDEEDLDTIDGSAAEGDDEIAPEVDVDDEPEEE